MLKMVQIKFNTKLKINVKIFQIVYPCYRHKQVICYSSDVTSFYQKIEMTITKVI